MEGFEAFLVLDFFAGGFFMTKTYGADSTPIKPTKIPSGMYLSIGRLIRAFSDIEDSLNVYISGLVHVQEAGVVILLGRTPISAKLKMALSLSKLHNKETVDQTNAMFFDQAFKDAKTCRNAVAHGVLLGQWGTPRKYAFLTDTQLEPSDFNMRREVVSYEAADVKHYADMAVTRSEEISKYLKLDAWREKRFLQSLLPHRKS